MELEHRDVITNGLRLHTVVAGPQDGPMVLMLHGFPEAWFGWKRQISALAERGYLVVVPDQRGYNLSDKPPRVRDYAMDRLVGDALGLIDAFGRPSASIVTHDWGGMVGWWLALDHSERIDRFCVMNLPHPRVFLRGLLGPQILRSWYVLALQLPWLPERSVSRDGYQRLVRTLYANSVRRPFTPEELDEYRAAWAQPGAIQSTIAWYRALARHTQLPRNDRVTVPTLIVWGKQDKYVGFELAEPSLARCDRGELLVIEEASHFVQHDAHEEVNAALARFLPGPGVAG